jgi:retron-type reverse transcriptase
VTPLFSLLARESGIPLEDMTRIIRTAPNRYKVFEIPKRSGGKREIAQPAREVKMLQRIIVEHVLAPLPVHPAAKAYQKGLGLLANAAPHAGSGPILKMDFSDFFPRIRADDWWAYCQTHNLLLEEDRRLSANLLFRRRKHETILRLSIGAPSSPMLSNVLMWNFDDEVAKIAAEKGITYTRYADDLTFSGQRIGFLKDMVDVVQESARKVSYPTLEVNKAKTTFVTAARRRTVTGVVLANQSFVGLGHERKRLLSAKVHHASLGKLDGPAVRALAGELAFAKAIDPEFILWLENKYGSDAIRAIKSLKA